jgi:hypothetical protein
LSDYDLPPKLQRSLAEAIPAEDLSERMAPVPKDVKIIFPEFDVSKRFNIVVYDEGPAEATAGHLKNPSGYPNFATYFETHFALTSRQTNLLTVEKLALLAERYAGRSVQLPMRETADTTLYGSAAKYRADVLDELSNFVADCGIEKLAEVLKETAKKRPDLKKTLDEIKKELLFKT